jgi:hypothetical protein
MRLRWPRFIDILVGPRTTAVMVEAPCYHCFRCLEVDIVRLRCGWRVYNVPEFI